ncbi:MAG: DUF885 domain-containing protein [Gemmatimonadaceae bacterium]
MIRNAALFVAISLAGSAATAQTPGGGAGFAAEYEAVEASRGGKPDSVRLRELFDVNWRYTITEFPEFATYAGYPGQNDRWTDLSPAAVDRRKRAPEVPLRVLRSIDRDALSQADRVSYDLFRRELESSLEGARFPGEVLQVTQLGGVHQDISQLLVRMPASKVEHYQDMLARLSAAPALIDQTIALLERGLRLGVTPARITLRDIPAQVRQQIVDDPLTSPLIQPFVTFPSSIPAAEQQRLRQEAIGAYRSSLKPAFQRLHDFLEGRYVPGAREALAWSSVPDGAAWYAYNVREQTTTRMSPVEIHALGHSEVRRIRGVMDSVIRSAEFTGTFAEFVRFLRTDPRFYHTDSASLVREYRDISKRIDPELVKLFGKLPRLPYGVTTIPSFMARSQTTAYYNQGSPKAGRPGWYYVNTYDLASRPKWEMEALSLHEAVPGHHFQIALAQEMENVPEFRRHSGPTAFVEGWALYAESLGPDLGFYKDPYSKFGQLTYEMWRAIRLVLDTGIHSMGWTREQAIDFFRENSAKTEHDITVEVDRYIAWPAQALAYKLGELKIKELRAEAERELGPKFDVRAFHDEVLAHGAIPLDLLEANVRAWIARSR